MFLSGHFFGNTMFRLKFVWAAFVATFCLTLRLGECSTDESSSSSAEYSGDCEAETSSIADGVCDAAANTAACGYDGGDCCACTCFVGGVLCSETEGADVEFSCEDPDAPSECGTTTTSSSPDASSYSDCEGYPPNIRDGYCDEANNNAACGYDGGDCCACTCEDDLAFTCGLEGLGFDCQDPDVPADCDLTPAKCAGNLDDIHNSICDSSLNNEECGYDGGDCCACTCREYGGISTGFYNFECGSEGYDCLDPNAPTGCDGPSESPTPSPMDSAYPDCAGRDSWIGDGYCDTSTNTLECAWDGGDCCRCTCVEANYQCTAFTCLDPSAPTDCATVSPTMSPAAGDDDYVYGTATTANSSDDDYYYVDDSSASGNSSAGVQLECQEQVALNVSDGHCDEAGNTAACRWDGGDCCECTCVDGTSSCGEGAGYNCLDPASGCALPTASPPSEGQDGNGGGGGGNSTGASAAASSSSSSPSSPSSFGIFRKHRPGARPRTGKES